ncbi:hypothetical protein RIF29_25088 [Crotalaria pallida]|uniref:Phosphoglycerate kinase n=1 Tax=Crotalaria pallida TaxID=3830 RepID=A0AAN9I0S3_CROPI
MILDFLDEVIRKPTVLIGNSVGSLACVIAAADSSQTLVRGIVLLNCAGGMNNKAIVDDWRIKLLLPLLWPVDFLLEDQATIIFCKRLELDYLVGAVSNPKRPFAAIVGGSKVSSKIGVIESLLEKVDYLLLGGGMIFTFYKAQGLSVGSSLVEEDKLDVATTLLAKAKAKGVSL